ncbi:MAG: flagellar hook-associated protein FlgK [Clostridia bacterium]|nr:flagellar hook-associated protein FlgK [Clostridia bacterium]
MAVSFASYEIPKSGLFVNERGLYVTGHNISNVNTPGYVRQQAMITTGPYQNEVNKYGSFQLGLGADIQQIRQIRHAFLDNMYRQENTTLGYWESRNKALQDVQSILGEPMGAGMQNVMNQFWDSWQELSKSPDSLTVRALVRQRGEALAYHINHVGSQLNKLQNDINKEIGVRIDEINQITGQISNLNIEIMKVEVSKDTANDLRDQRNTLVDRLSKLVNAEVYEMQDGQLDVTLGGYFLVSKGIQTRLYAGESKAGGLFYVPKIQGTDTEVPLRNGSLKGLMEARGEVFGATGSVENGSPYDKIDLVFAVNRDTTAAQKADIIANATALVNDYRAKGIDVKLGLVDFDSSGYSTPAFSSDLADFTGRVNAITYNATANGQGLEALKAAENLQFRGNAFKQFVLVTNSQLGTGTLDVATMAKELNNLGINTSIIGATGAVQAQLSPIAAESGNNYYDIGNISALSGNMYNEIRDGIYNNIYNTQNVISDLKNKLNLLVNVMAREVNSLHRSGKTLSGNNGGNFFTVIDSSLPMEMGNIKLSDDLINLNNIVASNSTANGDNTIALRIANMRHDPLIGKSSEAVSLDDFYRSIILSVGNNGNDADRISDNQRKLVSSADAHRQSIAGVSMDEEMTNMMKYKFAYDASSRALNVIDEMIQTVIERMGTVGR